MSGLIAAFAGPDHPKLSRRSWPAWFASLIPPGRFDRRLDDGRTALAGNLGASGRWGLLVLPRDFHSRGVEAASPHCDTDCDACGGQYDVRTITDRDEVTAALNSRLDHIAAVLAHTARPPVKGPDEP